MHLDLGNSYIYQDPVWDVIKSRFPVSIMLGLTGFLLSYLVCVPLGVLKAVKHGSKFDFLTSVLVFMGYAVPGWALGTALLVLFGGGSFWSVFPLGGFRSDNWEYLSWSGQRSPIRCVTCFFRSLCYMIGGFATLTILTKNSLMENMSQDYVRTAFAKGLHERRVIFVHALRNSLIPLATGLGHVFSLILAGSFLIERVFNIDGMGYLGYTSILQRDYPVALGILVISSPADADRQHHLRRHLRGRRSANPLPMTPRRAPSPPLTKRIRKFRRLKRGYYSFVIIVVSLRILVSASARDERHAACREVPGRVLLSRCSSFTASPNSAWKGSASRTIARLKAAFDEAGGGDWVLMPPYPYGPNEVAARPARPRRRIRHRAQHLSRHRRPRPGRARAPGVRLQHLADVRDRRDGDR